jgi:N-sulfoglucosamine sulfohydrolase
MSRGGFANDQGPFDSRVKPYKTTPDNVEIPEWLVDTPGLRQELVEYYEAVGCGADRSLFQINRLDQAFGMTLENLRRRNLLDSTLIIFTSDNGPPFINAKTTLFESGTCLPFLVRDPRVIADGIKGISNPNMVSFIDILPTMLDFCGLPRDLRCNELSPARRGRSILPIVGRSDIVPESEWQHFVFCSHSYHQRHV